MGGFPMEPDLERMEKLYQQLQKFHSLLEHITKDGKVFLINIEKVDLHGPVLDGDFIFDKIDVKEVSGALNIGNNHGVSVEGKKENSSIKPSAVSIKKTPAQADQRSKSNPSSGEAIQKYADLEKKLEEKLEQIFPKGQKSKKKEEHHKKTEPSYRTGKKVLPEKELKHPGQLQKISINNKVIE